jgi:hypothetical protein
MTVVTELDLPQIDLTSGALTGDAYHQQLASLPRDGEFGWLAASPLAFVVLDRESAEFFLRSRSTAFPGREIADLFGATSGRLREQIDANILNQQGDRHRRLRALVGGAFTPRAPDRWRPAMRAFLGRLWSVIDGRHSCEFVGAIAKPYPALTIAAVLGAPEADAPQLQEWSSLIQRQFDIQALSTQVPQLEQAAAEVYDYVEALLTSRAAEPGDDLLTALLTAEEAGDRLSHAECVNLVLNVIAGGIDTTQAQLSHAMRLLAARRAGADRRGCRGDPARRADHAVHCADLRGDGRTPRGRVPGRHDRGRVRRARQQGAGWRRGLRHHGGARRTAADLWCGPALLPRRESGQGRAGRGPRLPRAADARTGRRRTCGTRRRRGDLRR